MNGKTVRLLVSIHPEGIAVIRVDDLCRDMRITVEQQAANPQLGLICATTNLHDVIKTITNSIAEVNGS
jgi:hypothetical protein